ncbi:RHS repeat-associated core domain-containing protein, partial [Sphingobacterium shayense]|uniref:DUF6443 domain-containing protein n=1 Tax=Sphingobacterium shayense TaxID=626343 RepID=UPI001FE95069
MNKCNCLKIQRVLLCLLTFTIFANFIYAQPSSLVLDSYNDEPSFHAIDSIVLKDGFHIPIGKTVLLAVGGLPNLTNSPTSTQNYILTRTFRTPVIPANLNSLRKVDHENQTVQYFDGLGRPIQRIEVMASPSYKDIVTHAEYDGFGREAIKYLPYAEQSSSNGSFKTAAKINQSKFYKADSGWDTHVKKTDQPYAVTVFENSPLNRVSQQGSPGAAWQPLANRDLAATTGRTVETEYGTNVATGAEAVKLWKVTYASSKASGASSTSNYGAGKLYKTISKDENWILANGKGGTIEEYKDFEDRVVLKRNWESNTKALNTYYVYDDFGDLCYVIPPIVSANSFAELNDVNFSRYIYGYHYDNRRRLIEKKIPGKGWEWMAYNANDQEVLRQDALQRATGSWTYTKYDAFGRVAHTGLYTNTGLNTQAAAQSAVDSHPKVNNVQHLWEERPGTLNYIDRAFPIGETVIPHVINYYDDYTFNGATTAALQAVGVTKSQKTQTLLTGMRVTTVDGTAELLTINYYDDRGRLIQSASQNQLGGTDYVTNTYNFPGELLTSKRQHKASASGAVTTILTTNTYDHVGRILQTKKKVNTQAEILQSSLVYNEIGQLKQKDLHGIGTAAVQQISYAYNERGWTTSINNPAAVSAKKRFGMTFTYGGNTRAYNGNIASVQWNTKVA